PANAACISPNCVTETVRGIGKLGSVGCLSDSSCAPSFEPGEAKDALPSANCLDSVGVKESRASFSHFIQRSDNSVKDSSATSVGTADESLSWVSSRSANWPSQS